MHKKLHIWFYEWLAFIVNFYIIVVGMYFIEYMKLNLVLYDVSLSCWMCWPELIV